MVLPKFVYVLGAIIVVLIIVFILWMGSGSGKDE
jgi:hypothetical protein